LGVLAWQTFWFGGVQIFQVWIAYALIGIIGCIAGFLDLKSQGILPIDNWLRFSFILGFAHILAHGYLFGINYFGVAQIANMVPVIMATMLTIRIAIRQAASKYILIGIIVIGSVTSAYALYQFATQSNLVLWETKPAIYSHRYGSLFINPNHHAAFLICTLSLTVALLFFQRHKRIYAAILVIAAVGMVIALYATKSRGGWIGSTVSILTLAYALGKRETVLTRMAILVFLIIGIAGAVYIFSFEFRERIQGTFSSNTGQSGLFRLWLWAPAISMWMDHPLWGVGPGQFNARFSEYRTALTQLNPIHVHNEYLEALVEYGVVGFLFIVVFLSRIFYTSFTAIGKTKTDNSACQPHNWAEPFTTIGCTSALTGFAVHSFFEFNLRIPALSLTAAILIGTLIGRQQQVDLNNTVKPRLLRRAIGTLIYIVLFVVTLPIWFRYAREDRLIYNSLHDNQNTTVLIRNLKAAAHMMPNNPDLLFWIGEELRRSVSIGTASSPEILKEALIWLRRSEAINPHNARTKMTIGRCLTAAGQTSDALSMFQQAYKMSPNDILVLNPLAGAYFQNGNLSEAKKLLELSLSINDWDNKEARYYYDKLADTTTLPSKTVP
jgi:O-antigen ligase